MKLKKFIPLFLLALSLGIAMPALPADINPAEIANPSTNDVHARNLVNRLLEIRNIDKSNLTSSE